MVTLGKLHTLSSKYDIFFFLHFSERYFHRWPKLKLWAVIILRNSGHGANIRVCMGIFTIGFRRYKYWKVLNKNETLILRCIAYCLFVILCWTEAISRFATPKRKTRRHRPFRKAPSEKRKIPAQTDRAATNPTQNPSTNVLVSFQLNRNAIRALQPTPIGSLVSIIPALNSVKARVHIHHDTRPLKTQFLIWTLGALGSNRQETIVSIAHANLRPEVFKNLSHFDNSEQNCAIFTKKILYPFQIETGWCQLTVYFSREALIVYKERRVTNRDNGVLSIWPEGTRGSKQKLCFQRSCVMVNVYTGLYTVES